MVWCETCGGLLRNGDFGRHPLPGGKWLTSRPCYACGLRRTDPRICPRTTAATRSTRPWNHDLDYPGHFEKVMDPERGPRLVFRDYRPTS